MDKEKFKQHLDRATKQLIDFTKTLCFNNFAEDYKYIITPNSRIVAENDEHLTEYEQSVLSTWNKYEGKPLTAQEVVNLFHHNDKVPVWVDMGIYEARPDLTIIDLFCSRRLRGEKELMHPGFPPFHTIIYTPPQFENVEKDGKFDVNWKKKRDDKHRPKNLFGKLKQLFTAD